jgi:peptidoglycan hydrolase-like protein with peptidoglycan-binding domain
MAINDSPFLPGQQKRSYLPTNPKSVRRYQRYHKLPVTGTLNPQTSAHMRANNVRVGSPPRRSNVGRAYPPGVRRPKGRANWQDRGYI